MRTRPTAPQPQWNRFRSDRPARRLRGVTMIELMVALAIGSILLLGAVTVFVHSRMSFRVAESIARLQETARFAIDMIEPDIRMMRYFGLATDATHIDGRATALDAAAAGLAVANDCGHNWTINLTAGPDGGNNSYDWSCVPFGGQAMPGADTLAVRRVAQNAAATPQAGTLYVLTARFGTSQLFAGPDLPAGANDDGAAIHRLVVNGYYVSPVSSLSTPDNPVPSLRVKTLQGGASGPRLVDQEVLPGVEDLQIQLGVDTDAPGTGGRGSVNLYANPGDPLFDAASADFEPHAQVLAVRLWLRTRAERPEAGYIDNVGYAYADRNEPPARDGYRRMLLSKTIYLRNGAHRP